MDYSRRLKTAESTICLNRLLCTTKHANPLARHVSILFSQRNSIDVIIGHCAFALHRKVTTLHPRP